MRGERRGEERGGEILREEREGRPVKERPTSERDGRPGEGGCRRVRWGRHGEGGRGGGVGAGGV